MRGRFVLWFWELMRAISQVFSVIFRFPRWVFWGDCKMPDSNLTTSAWVGQASMDGYLWAKCAERSIDYFFGEGHCRSAAIRRE